MMETTLTFQSQMKFISKTRGHENTLDAGLQSGGLNQGANPKEFVLQGIAGCSGMDVVFYLKKHQQVPLVFDIHAKAELTTDTKPSYFKTVWVKYRLIGENLNRETVILAVDKSMTEYCGVSYMIAKVCPILYEVELNGDLIHSGEAHFKN